MQSSRFPQQPPSLAASCRGGHTQAAGQAITTPDRWDTLIRRKAALCAGDGPLGEGRAVAAAARHCLGVPQQDRCLQVEAIVFSPDGDARATDCASAIAVMGTGK